MAPADRTPTRCDTVYDAQQLLASAIASDAVKQAAAAFDPSGQPITDADGATIGHTPKDPSWAPGVFEYAAAVRANLPAGLAADDFDGVNVQQALDA